MNEPITVKEETKSKFFEEVQPTSTEIKSNKINVSYSQYALWYKCPRSWKLQYMDKLGKYEGSLHTVFGTSIHEVIQKFIEILYTKSAPEADALPLKQMFLDKMKEELAKPENKFSYKQEEYDEFCQQGITLLDFFTAPGNRLKYFPGKVYELLGIETPLIYPVLAKVNYIGYLDVVLKQRTNGKIKILDLKTSTNGWNKYQKDDPVKLNQLLLYKHFYSKLFKVPIHNVEVEFFILKRKLLENVSYPQSYIQIVTPTSGKLSLNETLQTFDDFVRSCFVGDGDYNKSGKFMKNPHKGNTRYGNCKWCAFSKTEHCDRKEGF